MAAEVARPSGWAPTIAEDAFAYLGVQRGRIADLVSDRPAWTAAYAESLAQDFEGMVPWLPISCDALMDVGGGMSGISILLNSFYLGATGHAPHVFVLDGEEDAPVVVKHAQPFNCHTVARRFLEQNGVANFTGITPACEFRPPPPCDLIISLASWCFHYNPEVYLEYVALSARKGAVLILDVRRGYKTWLRLLEEQFTRIGKISEGEKFERLVFRS